VRESEAQTVCVSALPFYAERALTLRATLRDCCENAFSSVVIMTTAGFCKRTLPLRTCVRVPCVALFVARANGGSVLRFFCARIRRDHRSPSVRGPTRTGVCTSCCP
jgi:hypothetical protein